RRIGRLDLQAHVGADGRRLVARVGDGDRVAGGTTVGNDRMRDPAGSRVVRVRRLHCESTGREGNVLSTTGAADADPRALVRILVAAVVGPATGRVLVADRLGVLMS